MYGVRGTSRRSVTIHVTRKATNATIANAPKASCHPNDGSAATGIMDLLRR